MAKAVKRTTTKTTITTGTIASKGVTKMRSQIMPTEQQVRERAFHIFLARNGAPGDPTADWLRAERELITELNR